MELTFKQFFHIVTEGTAEEVTALQKQITDLDVAMQQRIKPLQDRKTHIQAQLAMRQKQLDMEQKQQAKTTPANAATTTTTTTTPGSTGQQTPGVAQSSAASTNPTS